MCPHSSHLLHVFQPLGSLPSPQPVHTDAQCPAFLQGWLDSGDGVAASGCEPSAESMSEES